MAAEDLILSPLIPMAGGASALVAAGGGKMTKPYQPDQNGPAITEQGVTANGQFFPWFGMAEEGGQSGLSSMNEGDAKKVLVQAGMDDKQAGEVAKAVQWSPGNNGGFSSIGDYNTQKFLPFIRSVMERQRTQVGTGQAAQNAAAGQAGKSNVPFPNISPMAMQMFYQQTVAPYLQWATQMNNDAIGQYRNANASMAKDADITGNPVAKQALGNANNRILGAQMLNNAMIAASTSAPAIDQLNKNLNEAWQQGITNRAYVDATLGSYLAQSQLGGMGGLGNFASLLSGAGAGGVTNTPQANANQTMQNSLQNLQGITSQYYGG